MSAALAPLPLSNAKPVPPEYTIMTSWVAAEYFGGEPDWGKAHTVQLIRLSNLVAHPYNTRIVEGTDKLRNLTVSVDDHGLEEPLLICRDKDLKSDLGLILSGHRRIQSCFDSVRARGLDPEYCLVPVAIHGKIEISIAEQLEIVLRMNLRQDRPNPLEEAKMLENAFASGFLKSEEEAVKKYGYDLREVKQLRQLLNLPLEVQERIRREEFGKGIALALTEYKAEPDVICRFAKNIAQTAGMTTAVVEDIIRTRLGLDKEAKPKTTKVRTATLKQLGEASSILAADKGISALIGEKEKPISEPLVEGANALVVAKPSKKDSHTSSLVTLFNCCDKYHSEADRAALLQLSSVLVGHEDLVSLGIEVNKEKFSSGLEEYKALKNGSFETPDLVELSYLVKNWDKFVGDSTSNAEAAIGKPFSLVLEAGQTESKFVQAVNSLRPTFLLSDRIFGLLGIDNIQGLVKALCLWRDQQKEAGIKLSGRVEDSDEIRVDAGDLSRFLLETLRKGLELIQTKKGARISSEDLLNANIPLLFNKDPSGLLNGTFCLLNISNLLSSLSKLIADWPALEEETAKALKFEV